MTPDEMEKLGSELTRFLKSSDDIENVDLFGLARWQADREAAKDRRIEVLEWALNKYGRHLGECELRQLRDHPSDRCTCGFRFALSSDALGGK